MATTFTVIRAYRIGADAVFVEATAPGGEALRVQLWWSYLEPLTAAQRRAAIGQALADALAAQTPADLGIIGAVTG